MTHPAAEASEQPLVIQGPQSVQLLHGCNEGLHRGGVHEVERQQVVDAHGLRREWKNDEYWCFGEWPNGIA